MDLVLRDDAAAISEAVHAVDASVGFFVIVDIVAIGVQLTVELTSPFYFCGIEKSETSSRRDRGRAGAGAIFSVGLMLQVMLLKMRMAMTVVSKGRDRRGHAVRGRAVEGTVLGHVTIIARLCRSRTSTGTLTTTDRSEGRG